MNHLRKFNERMTDDDLEKSINRMIKALEKTLGVTVSEDGIITVKNFWGGLIANQVLEKVDLKKQMIKHTKLKNN